MRLFTVDTLFMLQGLLLQLILCWVLLRKHLVALYPIFFGYLLMNLAGDPLSLVWDPHSAAYRQYYFVYSVLDYVLQLLIILEIAKNVFRPIPSTNRPTRQLLVVFFLLLLTITVSFFIPAHLRNRDMIQLSLKAALVLAVLKLLLFASLAGFAQMLGIGWKNHVLQLATGLAFFACASLFVQMASSHLSAGMPGYMQRLDGLMHIQSAAFGATLVFWIWAFSRNEAPRKDFTPQMQEVLVTIAETARRTRLAVTRSTDRR